MAFCEVGLKGKKAYSLLIFSKTQCTSTAVVHLDRAMENNRKKFFLVKYLISNDLFLVITLTYLVLLSHCGKLKG